MQCLFKYLLVVLPILLVSCQGEAPAPSSESAIILNHIADLQDHFVPDRRVARFDVEVESNNGQMLLVGATNLPEIKDSLLHFLAKKEIKVKDEVVVWPDEKLGEKNYAITRHSVANLRSKKGHSQELATQVLLGTPLRVMKQQEEWYFVQCPDGYLAWIHGGELALKTKNELEEWKKAQRVLVIAEFSHSYQTAAAIQAVGDLVQGAILEQQDSSINGMTKVVYPDGRQAFVRSNEVQNLDDYLNENTLNFEQTLALAKQQIGKPYLWGGTSPKAMDCSGFTKMLYQLQGLIIPRDASQQVQAGVAVEYDEQLNGLEKGDLLFFGRFRDDGSEKITHVGLYIGKGRFIHSGSDNGANKEQSLLPDTPDYVEHRRKSLLSARRLSSKGDMILAMRKHEWYF